ncbi:MAG: oligosaccharide flippase family protein, partial [Candidatus Helarchaeota archaeon]
FGSQIFGSNVASEIASRGDLLLIGYFLSYSYVGFYSVAVSISMLFLIIPQSIQKITFPVSSEFWKNGNLISLKRMINKSMKYSACILLPVGLGVGFYSRDIIDTLFGNKYRVAVLPLCILLIARVISGSTLVPIGASFSGIGRPDISLKLVSLRCLLNITLNILFIPRFGIPGAAMATTLSLISTTFIALFLLPKILKVNLDIKWFFKIIGYACFAIGIFIIGFTIIESVFVGIFIVSAYAIVIYLFLLTKEDKELFSSLAYSILTKK